jgi:hypothetical protein
MASPRRDPLNFKRRYVIGHWMYVWLLSDKCLTKDFLSVSDEGISFAPYDEGRLAELVRKGRIAEIVVQDYFAAHYQRYGFAEIQGPYTSGPDFEVRMGRKWADAELETRWRHYLKDKHHTSKAFSDVRYLIVLGEDDPPTGTAGLPETIVHIDTRHFLRWLKLTQRKAVNQIRKHQARQVLRLKLWFLVAEFHARWLKVCLYKNRKPGPPKNQQCLCRAILPIQDWAPCHIPWFDSLQGPSYLFRLAHGFLRSREGGEQSFLSEITSQELDAFFNKHLASGAKGKPSGPCRSRCCSPEYLFMAWP